MTSIKVYYLNDNKTKYNRCIHCRITYNFDIKKYVINLKNENICPICHCIMNYEFNKYEFQYLFNTLNPNITKKDISKYKFIWKQTLSLTQKQKKISNEEYQIIIETYFYNIYNKINQITEYKLSIPEDISKKIVYIFKHIELLLFYYIDELLSLNCNILEYINRYNNKIIQNPKCKLLFNNYVNCEYLCTNLINEQFNRDIIYTKFILDELNLVSLNMSMYKDIEYYNLKSIHHIDWFNLGWMKSNNNNNNKLNSTDYKNLIKRLKKIPDELFINYNLINITDVNKSQSNIPYFRITTKYIYDIYQKFIIILKNSYLTDSYNYPDRIYQLACNKCIEYEKWELNVEQKQAIQFCIDNPLCFLIGEAGTGKTSVINAFIKSLYILQPQIKICILTPTGKATIRMREILNLYELNFVYTSTIHMLYKISQKNNNYIDYNLIIIDETSMFGIEHMKLFIDMFTEKNIKFIFIGDYQQLPSLCGSDFLYQMKLHHPKLVTELKINQRVKNNIEIIDFLNLIRNPDNYFYNDKIEYEFIQKYSFITNSNQNIQWIKYTDFINNLHIIYEPFLKQLNKDNKNHNDNHIKFLVQTLYSKNINNINKEHTISNILFTELRLFLLKKIQEYLYDINEVESPLNIKTNSYTFHDYQIGDLIMNKENIYLEDIQIMNGLFGYIENIYTIHIHQRYQIKLYKIRFETTINYGSHVNHNLKSNIFFYHNIHQNQKYLTKENEAKLREYLKVYFEPYQYDYLLNDLLYRWYDKCNIEHLQMSYITTIHKAQGSQWDNIILILDNKKSQINLLSDVDKQLFYTACSRTKHKLYIVIPDTITNYQLKIRDSYISPMYQSDYFGELMINSN